MDLRIKKQAEILVNYSLKVKKGENVIISGDFKSKPLALEIYKLLLRKGVGEVRFHFSSYEFSEVFFKEASEFQLNSFPQIAMDEIKKVDCVIHIGSETNTKGLSGVQVNKINQRQKTLKPLTDYRVQKTRWVITKYPTEARAQEAGMSLSSYQDFVFDAINKVDWNNLKKQQVKIKKLLDKTDKVRIKGKNTDLEFSIKGRIAESASGEHNMPDGEVFTSVVENSANGFIAFDFPALYMDREFENVRLEFKNGKVIRATATKGEKDLNKILDTDKGSRTIGEFGIGNNYKIKKFTKSILFDEKIGGTIHLALGNGYKETLSKNKSAIHWDMIKDLKNGGEIWFDDKLVQRSGKWVIKL